MKSLSLYFSPTGGGEKIAKAIQNGIDQNDYDYQFSLNLNKRPVSAETGEIETLPVIFTIPVYGGHMPKVAMERLNTLRLSHFQIRVVRATGCDRCFVSAVGVLAREGSCCNRIESAFTNECFQIDKCLFKSTVAIDCYKNGRLIAFAA